jgi:hypothetical protein
MVSDKGEMLFFFNHSDKPVRVAYAIVAARSVSRISEVAGTLPSAGVGSAALNFEMPAQGVRVYRMAY